MKKILRNIPTNIITGFLGAGKTTAIRHLLKTKPAGEKWAVLVNEFGEIGIDGALLAADGIAVKEVPGGCMCCAVGLPSKVALNQLIREHQPDRILIEPTGLAHPQQVVKQFSGPEYQTLLDLQAIVCMVDPWSICDDKFTRLPAFQSQVELADRVILTKADVATPQQLQGFEHFCQALEASRQRQGRRIDFATVKLGGVDWRWLTAPHLARQTKPAVHQHMAALNPTTPSAAAPADEDTAAAVTELTRKENAAEFGYSCGWQFPHDWSFDETTLLNWVESLEIPRVKGVVRCTSRWLLLNRMRTTVSAEEIPPAEGSRLEMIHTEAVDWDAIEQQLLQCRSLTP